MPEKKLKVKLISYPKDPLRTITAAIRQCYSSDGASKIVKRLNKVQSRKLIAQVISSGHTSTIEHATFTFAIEGVSRAMTHQLVRHRIASYSQQSQRYVTEKDLDYVIPPQVKGNKEALAEFKKAVKAAHSSYKKLVSLGLLAEDARFLLPNAAETKIVVTMNARALYNFFQERLCIRAQWEIRALAARMHQLVMKVAPEVFKYAGPTCETEAICWQGKRHCGKKINRKKQKVEVRSRV